MIMAFEHCWGVSTSDYGRFYFSIQQNIIRTYVLIFGGYKMRIVDGNIFEGMRIILPEHREAMRRLETEAKRQPRPVLDEQKIEEMSRVLADAIQDQRPITVIVYKPYGADRVEIIPEKIDPYSKQLKGVDREGNVRIVPLTDLIDVQV
jgi:hypothetical protein